MSEQNRILQHVRDGRDTSAHGNCLLILQLTLLYRVLTFLDNETTLYRTGCVSICLIVDIQHKSFLRDNELRIPDARMCVSEGFGGGAGRGA